MNKSLILILITLFSIKLHAQNSAYTDSIKQYIDKYVSEHEVVKGKDRKSLRFFPIDSNYRVTARLERVDNSTWFKMASSGPIKKLYRIFGTLTFRLNDTMVRLNLYQSQDLMQSPKYRNYLFLPFTDETTGKETYHGGRYIDLTFEDIKGDSVIIDFNKAYNPYCAYVSGVYNCPLPPPENELPVAVKAGEMAYGKEH